MSENTQEYTPLNELLLRIDETIDSGATVPFSNKKMIDADQLHELIDEIRISIPPEIKRAQEMEAQKKAILDNAKKEADEIRASAQSEKDEIIKEAKAEAEKLINEQEIIQRATEYAKREVENANQESNEIISKAQAEADNTINEARTKEKAIREAMVSNIETTLAEASQVLGKNLDAVNKIRDAIAHIGE